MAKREPTATERNGQKSAYPYVLKTGEGLYATRPGKYFEIQYSPGISLREYLIANGPWRPSDIISLYGEKFTECTSDFINQKLLEFNQDYADLILGECDDE